jgi:hypothetical protein
MKEDGNPSVAILFLFFSLLDVHLHNAFRHRLHLRRSRQAQCSAR